MQDPASLRDKAALCRQLATESLTSPRRARGSSYLFGLADQLEQEAAELEARFAGNKPSIARPPE